MGKRSLALCLILAACGKSSSSSAPAAEKPAAPATPAAREVWSGTLALPSELRDLVVTFEKSGDGAWTATMDVPVIQAKGIQLGNVKLAPEQLEFTLGKREHYALTRARDAAEASGWGHIAGQQFAIKMVRIPPGEPPRSAIVRPQTPRPPFPYEEREVTVDAPEGGKLAGTLTIPAGSGPHPAVLLWSGSGQQDRDEQIYGHRPYAVVADRLTREGLVTLRLDDRGAGKTVGELGSMQTEIADAGAAVAFLKAQQEVDAKRIGLIGHSTGGMVVPYVALETQGVAFIVSLAGPGVSGVELVPMQIEALGRAAGTPEEQLQAQVAMQKKIGAAILQGEDATRKALREILSPEIVKAVGRPATAAELDEAVELKMKEVWNPWGLSFFKLDPRAAWKKLDLPVLLLVGELDLQVPADANIAAVTEALGERAAKRLTARKLAGLNHLFQHAQKGLVEEYGMIEESFDPATLDTLAAWVKEQTALAK